LLIKTDPLKRKKAAQIWTAFLISNDA